MTDHPNDGVTDAAIEALAHVWIGRNRIEALERAADSWFFQFQEAHPDEVPTADEFLAEAQAAWDEAQSWSVASFGREP